MSYRQHVRLNKRWKQFNCKNFRSARKRRNTVAPNPSLLVPFSPLVVQPTHAVKMLFDLPLELAEDCISNLDIVSLSNFALCSVNCMALAQRLFENRIAKYLIFDFPSSLIMFAQVLMVFGGMASSVEVDIHMFKDMTSIKALQVMHRYCANSISRLMIKNFNVNLLNHDDMVTSLVANVEDLNLCQGKYENSGALFSNRNGKMTLCFIDNCCLDAASQEQLKTLKKLQGLMITPNIYLDIQKCLYANNQDLKFLIMQSKFPVLYECICEIRSLALLSCSVTSGLLLKLANLPNLQLLQLEGCGEETEDVTPLFDRLVTHTALKELRCFNFNVTKRMMEKLSMFRSLHILKLDHAVSTENLEDVLCYISEMAKGHLRQFHVLFKHTIHVSAVLFQFLIRPSLFTVDVHFKLNYVQCSDVLNKLQRESKEEHSIIISPRAIIWFKLAKQIHIDC